MALKSMKLTTGESGTLLGSAPEKPEFPHGLTLHLGEEAIAKLDLKELPEGGAVMMLHAKVEVLNVGIEDDKERGARRHLTLQVTDMELSGAGERQTAEEKLFGGRPAGGPTIMAVEDF